jgi:hypothetical protein
MDSLNYTPLDLSKYGLLPQKDHHRHVAAALAVVTGLVFVIAGVLIYPKFQKAQVLGVMDDTSLSPSVLTTSLEATNIPKLIIPFDKWVVLRNKNNEYEFKIPFPDFQQDTNVAGKPDTFTQVESASRGERVSVWEMNYIKDCQGKNECTVSSQKTVTNNAIPMTKYVAKDKNNNEFVVYSFIGQKAVREYSFVFSLSATNIEDKTIPHEDSAIFDKMMSSFRFLEKPLPPTISP